MDNPYRLSPSLLKRFTQFQKIEDSTKRFQRIIELGKKLEVLDDASRIEANQVKGCASLTYITGYKNPEGLMHYIGDSNSHLVKGLLALLVEGFNGLKPAEVLDCDPGFIEDMGISQTLTASRANGFMNTYNMMMGIARKQL